MFIPAPFLFQMISIVVPTFNEMQNGFFKKIISLISSMKHEIIVVDGFSTDGTYEFLKQFERIKLIQTSETSRAAKINIGIKASTQKMILLHHPRSLLSTKAINYLDSNQYFLNWGGFTHKFDQIHYLLKFTSWWSNNVRADISNIIYLDHCIFAQKYLLNRINLLPEIDIFEDTELSKRLREIYPPKRLPYYSKTSSIRFKSNGIWKQALMNQKLKLQYLFRFNHLKMNQKYEKGLNLNSKYS